MDLGGNDTSFLGVHVSFSPYDKQHDASFETVPQHSKASVQLSRDASPREDRLAEASSPAPPSQATERPTSSRLSVVLMSTPIERDEDSEPKAILTEDSAPTSVPTVRRMGRPKGWKPGMSYAVMRGNAPPKSSAYATAGEKHSSNTGAKPSRPSRTNKPPPNYSLKRRGRPHRQSSPPPLELLRALLPVFPIFFCEWSGCKAELQNMDTLRRHVLTVHKQRPQHRRCHWGKCSKVHTAELFSNNAALAEHIEQMHLIPYSWHVGDGPKNSWDWSLRTAREGDATPDFLKDRHGNQVTPSIRDQELEDLATYRNNRKKLQKLIMRRDEELESQSPSDTSEEIAEAG